jgi:hypothetical protein
MRGGEPEYDHRTIVAWEMSPHAWGGEQKLEVLRFEVGCHDTCERRFLKVSRGF